MRNELLQTRQLVRLLVVILFSALLTACGTEGGDTDPTPTSAPPAAQPTVATEEESPVSLVESPQSPSVPTNTDMSAVEDAATPAGATPEAGAGTVGTDAAATPALATPATGLVGSGPDATPVGGDQVTGPATPVAQGTEEAIPADTTVGDGTTGAMVPGTPEAATPANAAASPVASPFASPVSGASPEAVVTVTGCEVTTVPPFTGDVTSFMLTDDLNFRTGPGADCDLASPDPIGAFQVVEVIGGPVVRADDGTEWVQIRALGTDGWVVFEFLEPVGE